jgi:formate hydrogenlyase subunit 6/NADH:ubiquinone oxidoreductase subunit I
MHIIESAVLGQLLEAIAARGYALIGPTLREGAIVCDTIRSVDDLPRGYGDVQSPARYELRRVDDGTYFSYVVGPVSWKKFLFPPRMTLFSATRTGKTMSVVPGSNGTAPPLLAFIGVRPCELSAIDVQDRVFLQGDYIDPTYKSIRDNCFFLVVNCAVTGGNCFCASMGTGPAAKAGYDIVLTEIVDGDHHFFAAEAGSDRGKEVLDAVPHASAGDVEKEQAAGVTARAASSLTKQMDVEGLPQILKENFDHPAWDDVARRCLLCANCTMVCPTCFCSTVEDTTDLGGTRADRLRRWDSCFTQDFAKVAGGNVRPSARARYRQWLTHKLSNWVDQFGTMGCVGCGRCITWCPAGIDITVEAGMIRGHNTQE